MYVFEMLFIFVVLIGLPATPATQMFTQSTGLYVGGDKDAFFARFPAPVTTIVSPRFPSRYITNSFPPDVTVRRSVNRFDWL
jgi:hypothetical protein